MAITQERMLSVIGAGNAWKKAYEELCNALTLNLRFYDLGDTKIEELIPGLHGLARATAPPMSLVLPLATEERHYQTHAKKNATAKRRARGERAMAGAKPQAARIERELSNPNSDMPTLQDFEMAEARMRAREHEEIMRKLLKAQEDAKAAKVKQDKPVYRPSAEHLERIALNPDLATINEPPEPFDVRDL